MYALSFVRESRCGKITDKSEIIKMRPYTYHNHTVFCDGNNTVEEMVLSAIAHGCDAIGFSGHSFTRVDSDYCMPLDKTEEYRAEVVRIAEKYKDKIKVLLGIEQDATSNPELFADGYEYKIGSVHSVGDGDQSYSVDASPEQFEWIANTLFGGDYYALCEDYFARVAEIYEKTGCDIVGHIDLVTKFNEGGVYFDESNERYVKAAERAIKKLAKEGAIFEINTGAISRGYRKEPYPSKRLMDIIYKEGGKVTYSSDCHAAEHIICGYEQAVELAKECGFEGFMKLGDDGFALVRFDD